MSRKSMSRASNFRIIASLAFSIVASAAFAHAHLQKALPPIGGEVTGSPNEIRLQFSEGVEPKFSGVALITSAGAALPIGQPAVDPQDQSTLVAPIGEKLDPGVYTVNWHAVSVDTHRTEGSFTFSVR